MPKCELNIWNSPITLLFVTRALSIGLLKVENIFPFNINWNSVVMQLCHGFTSTKIDKRGSPEYFKHNFSSRKPDWMIWRAKKCEESNRCSITILTFCFYPFYPRKTRQKFLQLWEHFNLTSLSKRRSRHVYGDFAVKNTEYYLDLTTCTFCRKILEILR